MISIYIYIYTYIAPSHRVAVSWSRRPRRNAGRSTNTSAARLSSRGTA